MNGFICLAISEFFSGQKNIGLIFTGFKYLYFGGMKFCRCCFLKVKKPTPTGTGAYAEGLAYNLESFHLTFRLYFTIFAAILINPSQL